MAKRWYKNKPFSYLTQSEASDFFYPQDQSSTADLPFSEVKSWMDNIVKNKGAEKIIQLIVNRNITIEGPPAFSPDSFKSASFIDKIKNDAVSAYLSHYGFKNKDAEEVIVTLDNTTMNCAVRNGKNIAATNQNLCLLEKRQR